MRTEFPVVIIGGGATGTGILRDLALRGVKSLLVEKEGLASGTSGRFHGLLHSGARYAVVDPASAAECARENALLKKMAPGLIHDTGGYFVALPEDDEDYIDKWVAGCRGAGIEIQELEPKKALEREPGLNPAAKVVFVVPDGTIDGFQLAEANARAAEQAGCVVKTYTQATGLLLKNGAVRGVYLRDEISGQEELVECQLVINAAGAWADRIAAMAGIRINILHDQGSLLVFNHRWCRRVINRLRRPGDGDIIVPHGSVTILGTTSEVIEDPDTAQVKKEEVWRLLAEGEKLIPGLRQARIIRAFAGVRPIYENTSNSVQGREATRDFSIIDHEQVHGIQGIISAVGGKLTTFRLMAQAAADLACVKLGISASSLTDSIPLEPVVRPEDRMAKYYICHCERVSPEMLSRVVEGKRYFTLNDVRRLTRLGMGPCQGSFCTYRAAGFYHNTGILPGERALEFLRDHIQERWKGNRPALWGDQAQEVEITRGIYLGNLNLRQVERKGHAM